MTIIVSLISIYSKDTYGHGSHVAGIIWSNLGDWDTGVYMGVAPKAHILERARPGRQRHWHLRGYHPGNPVYRRTIKMTITSAF